MNKFIIFVSSFKSKQKLLCLMLLGAFLYSGLKNIGYPFIWNDESETLMTAESVLKNGFPKVHFDNNIIYVPENAEWVGYNSKYDMNTAIPWFTYYFSTIPVFLSHFTEDLRTKTTIVRIPFFLMGFIGVMFVLYSIKPYFNSKTFNYIFIFFVFFEILSIPLVLNIRETRYYALSVFSAGILVFLINRFLILEKPFTKTSCFVIILVLFLSFQTQYIFFISISISIFLLLTILYLLKNSSKIKTTFFSKLLIKRNITFLGIIMGILILIMIPFIIFYDIFNVASAASRFYNPNLMSFKRHFSSIVDFLLNQDFLILALFSKVIFYITFSRLDKSKFRNLINIDKIFISSIFSTILMIVFIIMCSKMPFLFTRHYVFLQPLLIIGMTLDVFGLFEILNYNNLKFSISKFAFVFMFFIIFSFSLGSKIPFIKGHIAELNKPVQGPLDFIIPAIKEKYSNTRNITVATNYEELSYIFYLKCKVVLGYNYKDLKNDLNAKPDVLVYRKGWGHSVEPFNHYFQKAKYERVAFDVYDTRVNNITELNWFFENHKFKTRYALSDIEKADMYCLVK